MVAFFVSADLYILAKLPINKIELSVMAAVTFDTLKYVRRLREACVPEKQAEAEAEALSEVFEVHSKELVTKDYLDAKFEKELSPIRSDLFVLKWMLALVIIALVIPFLKLLFV